MTAETLLQNANRNNALMSLYQNGDAPPAGQGVDWDVLYTNWIATQRGGSSTSYFVDPIGGSNSNDGSTNSPFADPTAAYAVMSAGDEIVIRGDGITITDNDAFAINDREHTIPSGVSRTNRTIIRAETPFGIKIQFTANTRHFFFEALRFESSQFMLVDGFIFDWLGDGGDPQFALSITSPENILTRTIIRRDEVADFGGFLVMPANYCLAQDVHTVGGARYGIQLGTGGTGAGGKNIVRRSVSRVDYNGSNQPMAPYSHYGNNSGFTSGESEFQNCFPIDGPYIDTTLGAFSYTWGGFYHPKNAFDIRHRGCAVISQGGRAGIWVTDNFNAHSYVVDHCMVVAENPVSFGNRTGIHANVNGVADNLTLIDIDGPDLDTGVSAANIYSSDTFPPSVFKAPGGADIRYAYGKFGSVWDETDFEALTTTELWNFPYEDKIKEIFSEQLNSPSGYTPSTNISDRGFCASNETFTRYIASFSSDPVDTVIGDLY